MSYRLHRCWFTKVPGNPRQTVLHLKANQKRCSWFPERSLATLRQKIPGHGWRTITCELSAGHQLAYRDTDENVTDVSSSSSQAGMTSLALALQRNASQALLPRGFPESVRHNYLQYAKWTALGVLCGRVQCVLATQAALFAVGLGGGAIPMAAAIQWVLKDGVGHAAAIVYATSVNTRFDGDAKRFRFQSTVAITLADFISVTMPFFSTSVSFLGVSVKCHFVSCSYRADSLPTTYTSVMGTSRKPC